MTQTHAFLRSLLVLALLLMTLPLTAATGKVRILQTNASGDNISIIDPATNKVVGEITGIERSHGVGVSPDGTRIYASNESESTLDVFDAKTLKRVKQVKLSEHPNNMAVAPDGRRVYVGISRNPGGVDIIDTGSLTVVKTVPGTGNIHNVYVSPDGKYAVSGSIQQKLISVIDTRTDQIAWQLELEEGIRPMIMSKNPDGSTKWLFVQITNLNGFVVVDFKTHKEISRVKHPTLPPGETVPEGSDVSHGLAVTPDQNTLLVNSRLNNRLYSYSLPELKLVGEAKLSGKGAGWLVLTPDGKTAYVANPVTDNVSAIDIKTLKEIALIPVGFVPKRNAAGLLP